MSNLPPGTSIADIDRAFGYQASKHSEEVCSILEDAGFPSEVTERICKIIDEQDAEMARKNDELYGVDE